jgi:hypothetical protein
LHQYTDAKLAPLVRTITYGLGILNLVAKSEIWDKFAPLAATRDAEFDNQIEDSGRIRMGGTGFEPVTFGM